MGESTTGQNKASEATKVKEIFSYLTAIVSGNLRMISETCFYTLPNL